MKKKLLLQFNYETITNDKNTLAINKTGIILKGITLIALVITIVQNFIACRCQEFDICIALNFKYILLIFLSLMSKYAMKSYIKS